MVVVVVVVGVVATGAAAGVCAGVESTGALGRTVGSLWVWVRPVTGGLAGAVASVVVVVGVVAVVSVWVGAVLTALVSLTFLWTTFSAPALAGTAERGSA